MSGSLEIFSANYGIQYSDSLREKFVNWAEEKYAQEFIDSLMDNAKIIANRVNDIPNPFKNGRKGAEYSVQIVLPDFIKSPKFIGLESIGLTCIHSEDNPLSFTVSGTPSVDGDQKIILEYYYDGWIEGMSPLSREFRFAINPDPRDLWKDIPVPEDIEYPKPDTDSAYVKVEASSDGKPRKDMVGASRRGRSHAHEGKPRDDHFKLCHCPESDWYILAVADGAGSAEFSREGSRIACNVAVDFCEEKLKSPDNKFDVFLKTLSNIPSDKIEENRPAFQSIKKNYAYEIIAGAAFAAGKAIREEAEAKGRQPKLYATTLLLTVCKKLPNANYMILSFNIGDGAIGVIYEDKDGFKANLNCTPDEGEFGGQTRFLTMAELFQNYDEIIKRIHIDIKPDFKAVIMMTDGVSDAKFETNANLNNKQKWLDLWTDITSNVHLEDDNENSKYELLEWLNFWVPGNHDDRTVAIIY